VDESGIFSSLGLGLLQLLDRFCDSFVLAGESDGCNESLDLGLSHNLLALLVLESPRDGELSNVVLLGEVEKLSDLAGALRAEAARGWVVSDVGNLLVTLLEDDEVENREIGADDAATNRLPLALADTAGSVARRTLLKEKTTAGVGQDTLLHGEALLVVATRDAKHLRKNKQEKIISMQSF